MNAEWWVDTADLDSDQLSVMSLPLDHDFVVLGPPGSGKTNLLLLRANYVAQAGSPNILIVVFGRALREFIVRGSLQYQFDAQQVKTSTGCFFDLLKQYGHTLPPADLPFEEVRLELIERVRALRATLGNAPYDAIFLDEAQDFLPDEIEIFCSLGKRIFAVADAKQKLYTGESGLSTLESRCERRVLTHHYRNGSRICGIADAIGLGMSAYQPMSPTSHYNETRQASTFKAMTLPFDQQVIEIAKSLNIQTKAFPNELFGVLCPRRRDVDAMYEALSGGNLYAPIRKEAFDDGYMSLDEGTQVCVTTIHGCKGLEFRAVHGAMLESLRKFPLQRNMVFTLATRAKTSLTLYGEPLPSFLQSAILTVEPIDELPPLERAFGRRGK